MELIHLFASEIKKKMSILFKVKYRIIIVNKTVENIEAGYAEIST